MVKEKELFRAGADPAAWFIKLYREWFGPTERVGASDLVLAQDLYHRMRRSYRAKDPIKQFRKDIVKILKEEAKVRTEEKEESLEYFLYEKILSEGIIGQIDAFLLTYIYYQRVRHGYLGKKKDKDWGRNLEEANDFWRGIEECDEVYQELKSKGDALIPSLSLFKVLCAILLTDIGARNIRVFLREILRDKDVIDCFTRRAFAGDMDKVTQLTMQGERAKVKKMLDKIVDDLDEKKMDDADEIAEAERVAHIISYKDFIDTLKDATTISTFVRMRSIHLETSVSKHYAQLLDINKKSAKEKIRKYPCTIDFVSGTRNYGYLRYLALVTGFPPQVLNWDAIGSDLATTIRGPLGWSNRAVSLRKFILKTMKKPKVKLSDLDNAIFNRKGSGKVGELTAAITILDLTWKPVDLGFWAALEKDMASLKKKYGNPSWLTSFLHRSRVKALRDNPLRYDPDRVKAQVLKGLIAVVEEGTDTRNQRAYTQSILNSLHRSVDDKKYLYIQLFSWMDKVRLSRVLSLAGRSTEDILDEDYLRRKVIREKEESRVMVKDSASMRPKI